jgi:hypothetical protein
MVKKDIEIYNSIQNQIEPIKKRITPEKQSKLARKRKNEEDSNIHSYKRYKAKKYFESAFNIEIKKAEEHIPPKRNSERDDTLDVSEEEEEDDEDTEELIRELQEKRPKKFFRNSDDESETEQSEVDIIFVIPTTSGTAGFRGHNNSFSTLPSLYLPACQTKRGEGEGSIADKIVQRLQFSN